MDITGLLMLLVNLIIVACVFGIAIYLVNWVGPPAPWALPIKAIIALILFIWVIAMFSGGVGSPAHLFWRR